ncbi:hypothetical protein KWH29_19790 [Xanthomonas campestris pv. paulliniae]|uniref:hypothetical protein n=1 Tax=Xanthomonas euvesicatoria TaxID=456327 RepID=UPI001C4634BC|nr:hypothetical protein [Xanthomonas euvesicatoria]MBV6847565.1 hypothetical protein [Xanthomonas campestris pv. paulliniae]
MSTEAIAWAFSQIAPTPESKLLLVLLADSADPEGLVHSPDHSRLALYCCTDAIGLQCALAELYSTGLASKRWDGICLPVPPMDYGRMALRRRA